MLQTPVLPLKLLNRTSVIIADLNSAAWQIHAVPSVMEKYIWGQGNFVTCSCSNVGTPDTLVQGMNLPHLINIANRSGMG